MQKKTLADNVRQCRKAGVPLIAIGTADPAGIARAAKAALNGKADTAGIVQWDIVRSARAVNKVGDEYITTITDGQNPQIALGNPVEMLAKIDTTPPPDGSVIIMHDAPALLAEMPVRRAVWNLRDTLKQNGSTLLLVGSIGWKLPAELKDDIISLTEPLPTDAELAMIARTLAVDTGLQPPDDATLDKIADATSGLSAYGAEQVCALNLSKQGYDLDGLWQGKRDVIQSTSGLSVWQGGETFADLGGLDNAKTYYRRILAGPEKPRCVLFLDEIEKVLNMSAQGDTSGTNQGFLASFLSWTQDRNVTGSILIGHPGSGKSALAKALGSEAGCPTVSFDLNAMKGSLVGSSETAIRAALATVDAIGRGRVLIMATSNGIENVPPEVRSRFTLASFFFDLPTAEERETIWTIYKAKYNRAVDEQLPTCDGWTGREIKACCAGAYRLNCTLIEAASYVVPVCRASPETIERLRRSCSGRYPSASHTGVYRYNPAETTTATATARKLEM